MTIRTRLNLWYATILCLALLVMGALCYHEFVFEKRHPDPAESGEGTSDFGELVWILGGTALPAVVLGLMGGWWLAHQALAPVSALTQAAERIHDQNLHEKLARSGNGDELDRLTEVFNAMTARLDQSFQRIREFTLHASHELKTPLTVLHGEMEMALTEEPLSPAQRERIASELDEIQRLAKIVDGLTLLTKADAGQIVLNAELLAFDELVRDIFDDVQILARPAGLRVSLDHCQPVMVRGDKHRLRQLLLNLGDNAVKYNQPGGAITFSLRRLESSAQLEISNSGAGIPPEVLPRVCDRFFRGDSAHASSVEGCGLGLSIAQWIATAHRGSLHIASNVQQLTTVTVRLPLVAGK
jgi:signal transduction histidine kinase